MGSRDKAGLATWWTGFCAETVHMVTICRRPNDTGRWASALGEDQPCSLKYAFYQNEWTPNRDIVGASSTRAIYWHVRVRTRNISMPHPHLAPHGVLTIEAPGQLQVSRLIEVNERRKGCGGTQHAHRRDLTFTV